MTVIRITEFTSPDMAKAIKDVESVRGDLAAANAQSIEIVSVGDGKGLVIAKYATLALMEAATDLQKQVFGKMIAAGSINGDSIRGQFGEVVVTI